MLSAKAPKAPLWIQGILHKYPSFEVKEVSDDLNALMFVQDASEVAALRSAARATVTALLAGMHEVRPGVPPRVVGSVVGSTALRAGGHAPHFWPLSLTGHTAPF